MRLTASSSFAWFAVGERPTSWQTAAFSGRTWRTLAIFIGLCENPSAQEASRRDVFFFSARAPAFSASAHSKLGIPLFSCAGSGNQHVNNLKWVRMLQGMAQYRKFDFEQEVSVSQMQRRQICQVCCSSQGNAALLFSTSTIFDEVIGDIGVSAKQALICWKQISSNFHACLLSKLKNKNPSMWAVKWSNTPCTCTCIKHYSCTAVSCSTICCTLLKFKTRHSDCWELSPNGSDGSGVLSKAWNSWLAATLDPLLQSLFQIFNLDVLLNSVHREVPINICPSSWLLPGVWSIESSSLFTWSVFSIRFNVSTYATLPVESDQFSLPTSVWFICPWITSNRTLSCLTSSFFFTHVSSEHLRWLLVLNGLKLLTFKTNIRLRFLNA